jgi:hypothetical protein
VVTCRQVPAAVGTKLQEGVGGGPFQKTSRLSQSFAVLSNHRNDLPAVEFGVEEFFGDSFRAGVKK